ncbi:AraC family transcriptional regulator [Dyella jiangningensis]|uniref:AraC family transcriptional regulator n=1 Tax=Dyella jiangningensis TaxID=1379159 RepID=A0A328PAY4_9GAMM|nr:AraC family transcriptional regulator [Dyella jiangningensis]RAO77506.1 AraC family transcriptional regulator [Dyella jiangningensis]
MEMKISADELEALFDALPDVVFFVKDGDGRYTHANLTLVRRLGLKHRSDVIGRDVTELFPQSLGGSYATQDQRVLEGEVIENQLEVHMFPNRVPGWCLTCKRPLRQRGEVQGIVGISRDLGKPDGRHPTYVRLRRVLAHLQEHYAEGVRVAKLAELADLSVAQLERHFRKVFQLTPQQLQTKLRIEEAMRRLHGQDSVAAIGLACGFADQSAFARQFKATVGMTPRDYRALAMAPANGRRPPVAERVS